VLHCRLHQETLGKGVDQCGRRQAPLDVRFVCQKFEVGEQYLDHAGAVDKVGDVGVGNRPPNGLELPPDRQILKAETEPHRFHVRILLRGPIILICHWKANQQSQFAASHRTLSQMHRSL